MDKLKKIIDNKNLQQRLEEDNNHSASKFNLDKTVKKYLAIYEK